MTRKMSSLFFATVLLFSFRLFAASPEKVHIEPNKSLQGIKLGMPLKKLKSMYGKRLTFPRYPNVGFLDRSLRFVIRKGRVSYLSYQFSAKPYLIQIGKKKPVSFQGGGTAELMELLLRIGSCSETEMRLGGNVYYCLQRRLQFTNSGRDLKSFSVRVFPKPKVTTLPPQKTCIAYIRPGQTILLKTKSGVQKAKTATVPLDDSKVLCLQNKTLTRKATFKQIQEALPGECSQTIKIGATTVTCPISGVHFTYTMHANGGIRTIRVFPPKK